jgi:hypothetical protein
MNVPGNPHRNVQRKIENSTTKGDMASTVPDRRGSI